MIAESGGIFGGNSDIRIPPEIESQWLKNLMGFENACANAKPQKIVDVLGKPSFKNENKLDDKKLKTGFARLKKFMALLKYILAGSGDPGIFIFSTWWDSICIQKKKNNFLLFWIFFMASEIFTVLYGHIPGRRSMPLVRF